eukprot:9835349-Ditylum_brightwellii.AAC.1
MAMTETTLGTNDDCALPPSPKRAKLSSDDTPEVKNTNNTSSNVVNASTGATITFPHGFTECLSVLRTFQCSSSPTSKIPPSLTSSGKTKNDLFRFRSIFDAHGFRTSVVQSPRLALSIYKDSCRVDDDNGATSSVIEGKEFILSMLGLHQRQPCMEKYYTSSFRNIYSLLLFCERIRVASPIAASDPSVRAVIDECTSNCCSILPRSNDMQGRLFDVDDPDPDVQIGLSVEVAHQIASTVPSKVAHLTSLVIKADGRIRPEQLHREYERILVRNSTFANARLQLFVEAHSCDIKDVFFKRSQVPKFERITVYLYDRDIDPLNPPRFAFLPSLRRALEDGSETLVDSMIDSFWDHLLRHGYFATEKTKTEITPELKKFLISGIANDAN